MPRVKRRDCGVFGTLTNGSVFLLIRQGLPIVFQARARGEQQVDALLHRFDVRHLYGDIGVDRGLLLLDRADVVVHLHVIGGAEEALLGHGLHDLVVAGLGRDIRRIDARAFADFADGLVDGLGRWRRSGRRAERRRRGGDDAGAAARAVGRVVALELADVVRDGNAVAVHGDGGAVGG